MRLPLVDRVCRGQADRLFSFTRTWPPSPWRCARQRTRYERLISEEFRRRIKTLDRAAMGRYGGNAAGRSRPQVRST